MKFQNDVLLTDYEKVFVRDRLTYHTAMLAVPAMR